MEGWSKNRIEIPDSVAMDILSKLPVKSLARFRCVAKPCCSYFQTSHFITKHYQNNLRNNNLNLLLKRCHGNTHDDIHYFSSLSTKKGENFLVKENIRLPFFEDCWYAPVVSGPCNGLLCLHDAGKVALWNPSTREFKTLPPSTVKRPPTVDSTRFGCLGFGFDSVIDDHKVVRFVTNYFDYNEEEGLLADWIHQVDLYSLKNDSWKEIPFPGVHPFASPLFNNYINGFYYWQATRNSEYLILSFDMINEKFSTLPLPNFGGSLAQYYLQLLDLNGLLGAIVYPREGTEKSFDLWVMNGSWSRQLSIESVPGVERPLGFWKNGELFLESSNRQVVLFDPSTQELKNLGIDAYQNTMQLVPYFESLVPINGSSEQEQHIIRQPM
ncbi:hypothetical protein CCACVL1_07011 [Corchorus capsularis]|uniref:Uncharacterized protein n=1 Tax=Corchorus capsularis TaxID=210143 RepID=A0A1R3JAF4_COCAP|nr:hypothetical protein CCACVL1_07011 [Corchorus capsularis]